MASIAATVGLSVEVAPSLEAAICSKSSLFIGMRGSWHHFSVKEKDLRHPDPLRIASLVCQKRNAMLDHRLRNSGRTVNTITLAQLCPPLCRRTRLWTVAISEMAG